MFTELQNIDDSDVFDLCIIGSGPAGITCALALESSNKRIILLEGGGLEYTEDSQDIYRGTVVGDAYIPLDMARLRYFGGSSNHWSGWCRPLDEIDFQEKTNTSLMRWPISKVDLDPYLSTACDILEVDASFRNAVLPGTFLQKVEFQFSPPVRFSSKYNDRLSQSRSICVSLNSSTRMLKANDSGISAAEVVDLKGHCREISASRYILACGGIENSRILLWSNMTSNNNIVKKPQTLGRYWMEHPHFVVGSAILRTDISFHKRSERVSFAPTKAAISSLGIKNCRLSLDSYYHEDKARQLIANIACVAPELATALFSMLGKHLVCVGPVYASWEQEPKFENCIELSGEIDKLGVPRPILRWKKSVDERKTVSNVTRLFGEYIAAADIGRVHLSPWFAEDGPYPENDELAGCHHMGGTRMSDNAEEGIVDRNCKVFCLDNLYIAGSSVFPSVGYANPTLTIVQLALRLADHLRSLN